MAAALVTGDELGIDLAFGEPDGGNEVLNARGRLTTL
jgi:hypothetical protein